MKEDNQVSQLGDYDAAFCEQQSMRGSCYISLFKFKSFDQFNTPKTAPNFRHLLSCGTIDEVCQHKIILYVGHLWIVINVRILSGKFIQLQKCQVIIIR